MNRLELGAGYSPTPGFMTLDVNPSTSPDFLGAAFPLPASVRNYVEKHGLFDELRAVDVLEHLSYRDTVSALEEWASVTKPGGMLYVQVPDAHLIMWWYWNTPEKLIERLPNELTTGDDSRDALMGAAWRLLGGHADGVCVEEGDDWRWNAHYALFSEWHLRACLNQAGWAVERIEVNVHPNLLAWAVMM